MKAWRATPSKFSTLCSAGSKTFRIWWSHSQILELSCPKRIWSWLTRTSRITGTEVIKLDFALSAGLFKSEKLIIAGNATSASRTTTITARGLQSASGEATWTDFTSLFAPLPFTFSITWLSSWCAWPTQSWPKTRISKSSPNFSDYMYYAEW